MAGKLEITLNDKHVVDLKGDLHGQDLYEVYVALTARLLCEMPEGVEKSQYVVDCARNDALKLITDKVRVSKN